MRHTAVCFPENGSFQGGHFQATLRCRWRVYRDGWWCLHVVQPPALSSQLAKWMEEAGVCGTALSTLCWQKSVWNTTQKSFNHQPNDLTAGFLHLYSIFKRACFKMSQSQMPERAQHCRSYQTYYYHGFIHKQVIKTNPGILHLFSACWSSTNSIHIEYQVSCFAHRGSLGSHLSCGHYFIIIIICIFFFSPFKNK